MACMTLPVAPSASEHFTHQTNQIFNRHLLVSRLSRELPSQAVVRSDTTASSSAAQGCIACLHDDEVLRARSGGRIADALFLQLQHCPTGRPAKWEEVHEGRVSIDIFAQPPSSTPNRGPTTNAFSDRHARNASPSTTRHMHEQTSAHSWLPSLATMGKKSLPCTSQALRGGGANLVCYCSIHYVLIATKHITP